MENKKQRKKETKKESVSRDCESKKRMLLKWLYRTNPCVRGITNRQKRSFLSNCHFGEYDFEICPFRLKLSKLEKKTRRKYVVHSLDYCYSGPGAGK